MLMLIELSIDEWMSINGCCCSLFIVEESAILEHMSKLRLRNGNVPPPVPQKQVSSVLQLLQYVHKRIFYPLQV